MQKLPTELIKRILKIKWWNARKEFLENNLVLPNLLKTLYESDEYGDIPEDEDYEYYTFKNNKHYYFSLHIDSEYGNLSVSWNFSCDDKKFYYSYFEVFF